MKPARDRAGRFVPGCPAGPGRPKGKGTRLWTFRRAREVFEAACDDRHFAEIVDRLVELAKGGDLVAIRLVLLYRIGRPIPQDEAQHLESLEELHEQWESRDAESMDWSLLDSDSGDDDANDADDADGNDCGFVSADEMLANLPQESLGD